MSATNTREGRVHEEKAIGLLRQCFKDAGVDLGVVAYDEIGEFVEEIIRAALAEVRPDIRALFDAVHSLDTKP